MTPLKDERGFTLIEMLAAVAVLAILIGMSALGVNCVLKNTEYFDSKNVGSAIYQAVDSYYMSRDTVPVLEGSSVDLENDTIDVVKKKISKIELLEDNGLIYEIDPDKISFNDDINKDDIDNYVVLFVSESDINNNNNLKGLDKYNGTVIKRHVVNTCSNNEYVLEIGKKKNGNVSESLNFEISDDYIEVPNSGLEDKLNR